MFGQGVNKKKSMLDDRHLWAESEDSQSRIIRIYLHGIGQLTTVLETQAKLWSTRPDTFMVIIKSTTALNISALASPSSRGKAS